ncbi:MAG: hypothetical protein VKK97_06485 [Synechococcaceae cyanobacterium]|nr:hypothetical protein [Synechococcaceae cyanobacterium]
MPVRSFSRLAVVFVVLFVVLVLGVLLPFEPLDPAWQSRLTAALVNAATLPLLALALLQLAWLLDPDDPVIRRRQQRFARLAIAASFGFLLLAPLQIRAGLRLQGSSGSQALGRLERAEHQLAALRQAVAEAASPADLGARFQKLSGPSLSPTDLALPLPLLKAQAQVARERAALPAMDPLRLLPEQLRSAAACLAIACGFAVFARRPEEELSLLDGIAARLSRLKFSRINRGRGQNHQEYLRQLQGGDQDRG